MKKIDVKGPIIPNDDQWIYDWLGMDATSPKKVLEGLCDASGDEVEININSGGGSVFDGSEIYTALRSYESNVYVNIVGIAASAASVIAMAGDKVSMSPTSQMMIHNASIMTAGDYHEMDKSSEILKNVNETIANAYQQKSGISKEELLAMMDKETWLTPQQALENKLIDEVMFEKENITVDLVASTNLTSMLPKEVVNKIRNAVNPANLTKKDEADIFMHQKATATAKLNLLKLKSLEG